MIYKIFLTVLLLHFVGLSAQQCEPQPPKYKSIAYTVYSTMQTTDLSPFTIPAYCPQYTLRYSAQSVSGGPIPSFMKFNPNTLQLTIQSNTNTNRGTYSILISAQGVGSAYQNMASSKSIKVDILAGNSQAPIFKEDIVNMTIRADERTQVKLPKIYDSDDDTVKVTVFPRDGSANFTVFKNKQFVFNPTFENVGNYTIEIILIDENPNPMSSYYTFGPQITSPRGKQPGISKYLNATITEINEYGEMTLQFNSDVNVISDYQNQEVFNQTVLRIRALAPTDEDVPANDLNFTWACLGFTTRELKFQIYFRRPKAISFKRQDIIQVDFKLNERFIENSTGLAIRQYYRAEANLTAQKGIRAANSLNDMGEQASATLKTVMLGNLALNILMAASLQYLWGMINVLQIIVHLPLLNLIFPDMTKFVFSLIVEISQFDILPMSFLQTNVLTFDDDSTNLDEKNFNDLGYESTVAIQNMGSLFYYILFIGLTIVIIISIRILKGRYIMQEIDALTRNFSLKKIYDVVSKIIFFNLLIRFLLEGYLQFAIDSLLQQSHVSEFQNICLQLSWETSKHRFSALFSILLLAISVTSPLVIVILLLCLQRRLNNPTIFRRMGSLYEGLRTRLKLALIFNAIFVIRRLAFACIIVFLQKYPTLQIIAFFQQSALTLIYVLSVKPFSEMLMNRLEIFNECCILANAYHLLAYTDFLPSTEDYDELRVVFGNSMIAFTSLNVVVNTLVMLVKTLHRAKLGCIKGRIRFNAWRAKRREAQLRKNEARSSEFIAQVYKNLDRHKYKMKGQQNDIPINKKDLKPIEVTPDLSQQSSQELLNGFTSINLHLRQRNFESKKGHQFDKDVERRGYIDYQTRQMLKQNPTITYLLDQKSTKQEHAFDNSNHFETTLLTQISSTSNLESTQSTIPFVSNPYNNIPFLTHSQSESKQIHIRNDSYGQQLHLSRSVKQIEAETQITQEKIRAILNQFEYGDKQTWKQQKTSVIRGNVPIKTRLRQ
ncbi:hypothetical protein FGO68_gene5840 [Halteria grandinella]|uniref:Cadherin domain-containing protein n=1 Tax=Halteria grandinella TaxID=5974 RepID=A0A8J8P2D3_HALGN|nr:hypothetical protein FGO68_gene5840 [Halteria grandinella]